MALADFLKEADDADAAFSVNRTRTTAKEPDPLAQAQRQNELDRQRLTLMGEPDPTVKPKPSALERIFGVLDVPGAGVRSLAHNLLNPVSDADVNPLQEMLKAAQGKARVEGADILADQGVESKWGKMLGGIVIDILLDPVTYLTAGIGGAGKGAVTSTLDDVARGVKSLDEVLDAGKAAKYAAAADEAGGLTNISKALSQNLYDDVAKALGYKDAVKFMGVPVGPKTSGMGRTTKAFLRGQTGTKTTKALLEPISMTLEKAFVSGDYAPIYREGNEVLKAFTTHARRNLSAQTAIADSVARSLGDKIASLVPDEKTRSIITKGIGEQFGDVDNLSEIAKAFDKVKNAADDVAREAAILDLNALKARLFDGDAIARNLVASGIQGTELDNALAAAKMVQDQFGMSLKAKQEAGIGKALFGEMPEDVPQSAGYVPGFAPTRTGRDAVRGEQIATEVFGQADTVAAKRDPLTFAKLIGAGDEGSKTFLNAQLRREGTTLDDLVEGTVGSAKGLETETDIARLASKKTRQDMRRLAYEEHVSSMKGVLGDNPEVEKLLRKGESFFLNDDATNDFLKMTDGLTNTWRKLATVWNFPMFTARNAISNQFMKFTEGLLDPEDYAKVAGLMTGTVDNITLGGAKYTKDEFVALAKQSGVIQDIANVSGIVGSQLGKKQSLPTRVGSSVNQTVETLDRLQAFVTAVNKKGLDPKAASALVDRALLNYAPEALTMFERNVMRRIVPFYTFTRRNTPHMVELLATKPGTLTWIGHAQQTGANVTGISTEEMPDYLQNLFGIPLPNGQILSTGGVLPIQDLERIVPQNPREYAREQLTALNPWMRDPMEFLFNKDLWRDTDIQSFPGELRAAPDYVQLFDTAVSGTPAAEQWEFIKQLLGMAYMERSDGEQYLAMNPTAAKLLKDLLPFMSGVARGFGPDDSKRFSQLTGIKLVAQDTDEWARQRVFEDKKTLDDTLRAMKQTGAEIPTFEKQSSTKTKTLADLIGGK